MTLKYIVALLVAGIPISWAYAQNAEIAWNRVIDSRKEIRSGHLEISYRILCHAGQKDHELCGHETKYEIWFDGPWSRFDKRVFDSLTGQEYDLSKNLSFRRVFTEDKTLNCLSCDSITIAADEFSGSSLRFFPPIALGCVEGGFFTVMSEDNNSLLSFDRVFAGFREAHSNDENLLFKSENGELRVQMSVPSQLPELVDVNLKNGYYESRTKATWKLFDSTGEAIWFPSDVDFQDSSDGQLLEHHVARVLVAEFNQGVDHKLFTWEGMHLPEGKMVSRRPDGSDVVEMVKGTFRKKVWVDPKLMASSPPPVFGRWIAVVLGIIALCMFFFVRKYRF